MNDNQMVTNPIKAIRAKCLDCCNNSATEVQLCPATDCALHPFRVGRNPYRQPRVMSDERKAALAERLRMMREAKKNANTAIESRQSDVEGSRSASSGQDGKSIDHTQKTPRGAFSFVPAKTHSKGGGAHDR